MIGSMAPADIAATRLLGMSPTSQSRNEGTASWGAVLAERSMRAASGSSEIRAKIAGATSRVNAATAARVIEKKAIPLAPSLPRPVPPELTPVKSSVVTSGITMSWSARVQIVPIGSIHPASSCQEGGSHEARAMPSTSPASKPSNTRVVKDMAANIPHLDDKM